HIIDLDDIQEGLSIKVDQPKWFMREGQLTVNLYLGDVRMYSLVFSLSHQSHAIAAYIGCIQGRDFEGVVDEYRKLTKVCHGMRPRDLLIETFRMLCAELGVTRIFAVADDYRLHRHHYFGKEPTTKRRSSNYDEIWADRGVISFVPPFFELSLEGRVRDLTTI